MLKRVSIAAVVTAMLSFMISSCGDTAGGGSGSKSGNPLYNANSKPATEISAAPIVDWMELLYYHIANEKIAPPAASRIYGYTGVLIYESLISGMPDMLTMEGQLNELEGLPRADKNAEYDWLTVMNEALYYGSNYLLERAGEADISTIDALRESMHQGRTDAGIATEVLDRSKAYGRDLAIAIEEWAKQDNFDKSRLRTKSYKELPREGKPHLWEPTDFGQTPLEPYWGDLRPFVMDKAEDCGVDYPYSMGPEGSTGPVKSTLPEFSTDPESDFYKACLDVYEKDKNLSEEERIIALFWADDPGETSTPPGHWIYIMNNMNKSKDMNLQEAAEMYALTSLGIADAFIAVWDTKYRVYLVRPKTYIQEFMGDDDWEPYVETPPFPEYASGHSGVSGSAATLLTHLLGDQPFVDSTHLIIGLDPRSFDNFWHAAEEAAESRHYGGIHYRAAIEDALEQGKCVAERVLADIKIRVE